MIVVGTRSAGLMATVDAAGGVEMADGSRVDWWVAAEDRWHTPPDEPTIRQVHSFGVPVVETMVRVPGGDVVQRVYAEAGGLVVVEFENQSTRSVAIAISRRDLRFSRPPAEVSIEGIVLPADAVVLPLAHTASVRVGAGAGPGMLGAVPTAEEVRRGWQRQLDHTPRLVLPDSAFDDSLRGARADVLLGVNWSPDDLVERCLAASELVRLGEPAAPWVDPIAEAVALVARQSKRGRLASADHPRALRRAAEVLRTAGDERAATDVDAIRRRVSGSVQGAPRSDGIHGLVGKLDSLGESCDGFVSFLSDVPREWFGQPIEVHDLPVAGGVAACAVRWHGERPAILWEAPAGFQVRCTGLDPTWVGGSSGEALLAVPVLSDRS